MKGIDFMYCRKCGARIADGVSFCTSCGERVAPLAVTIEEQPTVTAPEVTEAPVSNESQNQNEPPKTPVYTAPTGQQAQSTILPPVVSVEKHEKVKTDFGKGALAFCLVIIGLLAISTGVFAGLYFSLL